MSGQAERGRYKGSIPHCPERPLDQGFTPIAARNHSFSATRHSGCGSAACRSRHRCRCRTPRSRDCRPLDVDGGERTHPHQHLAAAGVDRDAPLRLRQRQAETDHGGAAAQVAVAVAERGQVPGGRTEAGHDEEIVAASASSEAMAARRSSLIWSTPFCRSVAATAAQRRCARRQNTCLHGALVRTFDFVRRRHAIDLRLAQLEHRVDDLPSAPTKD